MEKNMWQRVEFTHGQFYNYRHLEILKNDFLIYIILIKLFNSQIYLTRYFKMLIFWNKGLSMALINLQSFEVHQQK